MNSSPDDRVDAAINALYLAFAHYPYRASMPACAHCVSDEDLLALGAVPVRDLPAGLLARYALKAVSTWGEANDLKRVLPRLLELTIAGKMSIPAAVVTTKLQRAGWQKWPAEERRAVWQCLSAWWRHTLAGPAGSGMSAHRLLDAISMAEADLEPYFSDWHHAMAGDGDGRLPATLHLVELLSDSPLRVDQPDTVSLLAPDAIGDAAKQYTVFLLDPATDEELERALADFATTSDVRRIAVAYARLRRFTAAASRG